MRQRTGLYALCIVCLLSLFLFLGDTLFNTRGEPREAIVAYSMIEHGNWILPVNNGDEIAFKPPLLHWLIAGISTLAGGVNELTSRLPSALALSLMTLGVYAFYARRRGVTLALLTAGITLANFEVHRAGMACRVDMLLAALMVGALLAMYRWTERHERGIPLLAWLCLSGAALTKGPVGVLLPCAVVGVYLLMRGRGFWYATWRLSLLAAFSLLPLFGWYALAFTLILLLLLPAGCRHLLGRFRHRRKDAAASRGWWTAIVEWCKGSWQRLCAMDDAPAFPRASAAPTSCRSTPSWPIMWRKASCGCATAVRRRCYSSAASLWGCAEC